MLRIKKIYLKKKNLKLESDKGKSVRTKYVEKDFFD